jgi:hypothetical protein
MRPPLFSPKSKKELFLGTRRIAVENGSISLRSIPIMGGQTYDQ